jgi:hypothetical protein
MWTFAAFIFGFWAGVMLMCILHLSRESSVCKQNFNQGRECDCAQIRRNFESET